MMSGRLDSVHGSMGGQHGRTGRRRSRSGRAHAPNTKGARARQGKYKRQQTYINKAVAIKQRQ